MFFIIDNNTICYTIYIDGQYKIWFPKEPFTNIKPK